MLSTYMAGRALTVLVISLAAGCSQRQIEPPADRAPVLPVPPTPARAVPSAAPVAPMPTVPTAAAPGAVTASAAVNLDGYKLEIAGLIHQGSADLVYEGAPPHLLRSIVVVTLTIDSAGRLTDARVARDNGDADMTRAALDSARRAAPYPRPPARVLSRGQVQVLESWLFRKDGKFRLRTLAKAQQE